MKPTIALLLPDLWAAKLILPDERQRLSEWATICQPPRFENTPDAFRSVLAAADGCLTTWDVGPLTPEILDAAPNLKIIAHAAGSVKPIVSEAVWQRGIRVTSAAAAIAIGVAEHALGLMLSTMKRTCWFNDAIHRGGWREPAELARVRDMYRAVIGVVGAGAVGRHMLKLLQSFEVQVLLYDPFVSEAQAREYGAEKVADLDELLSRVDVVSLHAPSLPETRHLINRRNLKRLRDDALIINTARGALIDEAALFEELSTGRLTACLDVTDPEPPAADHPLRQLPNVVLTPHIAGACASNLARVGSYALAELERFFSGKPLRFPVVREDLSRIA